ncbi:RecQ family ATP-dependent DNA helicase (plasmid) [Pseudoalteromonas sp. T1lg65]|uniref:RecQ family ATP-dependent DNA helicase n=1 Tax=Pseudoalteromonas sp. T1lg65 TaxID=2077101 RepID=UPI003F7B2DDC
MTLPTDTIHTLQHVFGHNQLRPGQQQVVETLLAGNSTLAIFATGAGKSLCYQLPALLLDGLCIVVSPLLALIHEQKYYLQSLGINAESLDSTQTNQQSKLVEKKLLRGELKILFISVERLANLSTQQLIKQCAISMLVIDEAHCISEWGHNFRPEYQKLVQYREKLGIKQVLLLTATATNKVANDMADKFRISPDNIVRTGFYRSNLNLSAIEVSEQNKEAYLLAFLKRASGAGIIYVTQQKQAEALAKLINAAGFEAKHFHAGVNPADKAKIQSEFLASDAMVVVATIAFGMGVDKPNIRWVLHYDMPKSLEGYSQEIGRAGRDGQLSHCVALLNNQKRAIIENYIFASTVDKPSLAILVEQLFANQQTEFHCNDYELSQTTNISTVTLKTLIVNLELSKLIEFKYSYFKELQISLNYEQQKILSHFPEQKQPFLVTLFSCITFARKWGTIDLEKIQDQKISFQQLKDTLDYLQTKQLIDVKASKYTSVYHVNYRSVDCDRVIEQLYQQSLIKEQGELKRVSDLMRFFQIDTCYHQALARYFGDKGAPEQCGHCSVCQGKNLRLTVPTEIELPDLDDLKQTLLVIEDFCKRHGISQTARTKLLFLLGINCPWFSKYKIKQLSGFGNFKNYSYKMLLNALPELNTYEK